MVLHDIAKDKSLNLKMISENELDDLHKVLLIILDDLIALCKENNLHFILIGGSAIGALREQGFIAWDDDIDIAMPRTDFEALYEIVQHSYKNKYSIIHPQSTNNYGRVLPKIRLKGTEYRTILEKDLDDCGVFIDIYIIENIPNNYLVRYMNGFLSMVFGFGLSCRRLYKGYEFFKKYNNSLFFKIKSILGFFCSFASIEKWAKWTDYWYSRCKDETSKYVGVPADDFHYFGEIYERSEFCRYKEVDFECRKCWIPTNYDSYLRKRYGNYMITPNKDNRERNCYIKYDLGSYKKECS